MTTELIQLTNQPKPVVVAIMSNLSTGKINPSGTGSYLSEIVFIALHRNLPELVEAATGLELIGTIFKQRQKERILRLQLISTTSPYSTTTAKAFPKTTKKHTFGSR
jgi:hypothetical protein